MIKCVLFDLDGVLLNAKEIHYEALNEALYDLCSYKISRKEHLSIFDGLPTRIKLDKLKNKLNLDDKLISEIKKIKQQKTIQLIRKYIEPLQNQIEVLSWLREDGYKLGVCTNSVRETLSVSLQKLNISDFFDIKLSNQDVNYPKPSPEIYTLAMSRLNCLPGETLIFEDNFNGIAAAKASKAFVFEVASITDINKDTINKAIEKVNNENSQYS